MPEATTSGFTTNYRMPPRTPSGVPTVLCLHGSGADSIVWSAQISRLRRDFAIIAPDLPAHGRSGGQALQTAAHYANWLHAFTETLSLKNFLIMGHSFGGAIAQEYARLHPECVQGLVLIGTGTRFRLSGTYLDLFEKGLAPDDPRVRGQVPEEFLQAYAFLKDNSSPVLHADLLAAGRFDSRPWIGSVSAPALVVRGENDFVTPPDMPAELAAMLPNAELTTIADAGHVTMLDARDEFNKLVTAFFQSCC